ncbi:hypothetical protein WDZ92_45005, partial [Nostoc sp. NIES-2111]
MIISVMSGTSNSSSSTRWPGFVTANPSPTMIALRRSANLTKATERLVLVKKEEIAKIVGKQGTA